MRETIFSMLSMRRAIARKISKHYCLSNVIPRHTERVDLHLIKAQNPELLKYFRKKFYTDPHNQIKTFRIIFFLHFTSQRSIDLLYRNKLTSSLKSTLEYISVSIHIQSLTYHRWNNKYKNMCLPSSLHLSSSYKYIWSSLSLSCISKSIRK